MIRNFHVRHYEHLQIEYLEMIKIHAASPTAHLFALYPSFGAWNDRNGYAGSVPTHKYFRGFYDSMIERHALEIDQHMAMLPARIIKHDQSFKVCRCVALTSLALLNQFTLVQLPDHLGKMEGEKVFDTLHTATNQDGEVRTMILTPIKAHNQYVPTLAAIPHSLHKFSHGGTELVYTDNVHGDKTELECAFLALFKGVSPVPSSSLEPLELPPDWEVHTLTSKFQVNNRLDEIMEDLSDVPHDKFLPSVVDFEWPVDITTGIQGCVALMSLSCEEHLLDSCQF